MSRPTVRVNTFVKETEKPHIDPISKMFITSEIVFGYDRLPLLGKGSFIYVSLTFMICVILYATIFCLIKSNHESVNYMMMAQIIQSITCTLLSFTSCKWMLRFYSELSKFDAESGCRPKVSISSIQNAVQATLTCILIVILFIIPLELGIIDSTTPICFIPMHVVNVIEVHYFGHLLNLLTPRLKLINHCLESSLSSTQSEPRTILKKFVYFKTHDSTIVQCRMKKLMDLYQMVVEAYDCLNEGIKWQLLVTIITAFITVLGFLFMISLEAIHSGGVLTEQAILQIGIPIVIMVPLFAPCTFGDRVHNEVRKLRELLASRLYENKLDKSGRSVARALLAFTETRDLSFRLLRMLNIDISLPFKFVGLLVTYLIILLQFEKVINP